MARETLASLRAQLAAVTAERDHLAATLAANADTRRSASRPVEPLRLKYRELLEHAREAAKETGRSVKVPSYAEFEAAQ